jgi:mevalonate kinase
MTHPTDGIPAARLPLSSSAPGKCIVFGEHSVVHGGPELLFALDLRTQIVLRRSAVTLLNGEEKPAAGNPFLAHALADLRSPGEPIDITAVSRVPRAAGLGSSAAFVAALAAGLSALSGGIDRPTLAQRAFAIERGAQGVGSPGDTSAAVAGGFLALNTRAGTPLWEVAGEERSWTVRRVVDPHWGWVVASSGVPRSTAAAVNAVADRLARPDGPALLARFRQVADAGIGAVEDEDRVATGRCLRENQELLREVGVSHPKLEKLLEAVRDSSEGEKLTGAGCGGSIVALPKPGREMEAVRRIRQAGGVPFVVVPSTDGARLL